MKYTLDMIAVMQAFCNGKQIESRLRLREDLAWEFNSIPQWNWELNDYRIKKTKKTYYMVIVGKSAHDGALITSRLYPTREMAASGGSTGLQIVEVIVEEE